MHDEFEGFLKQVDCLANQADGKFGDILVSVISAL